MFFATFIKSIKIFRKPTRPPLPLREAPPLTPTLSPSGEREETALLGARNRYALRLADHQRSTPDCAGWNRLSIEGDNSAGSTTAVTSSASTALDVVQKELKELGLWKFAGAVMYVLKEVLGLSEDKMIVPMDEKRGRLLLAEILDGGNFGRHFTKYAGFTHHSMGKKYFLKIWRNMHFVRYYPAEALCEPLFRTWHFFWRLKYKK